MSNSPQEFHPLGRLVSLITLLAIALYFAGWIYRWTYYGFFHIQVTSLGLPLESFYLAAFRALAGDPGILLRSGVVFGILFFVILISLESFGRIRKFIWFNFLRQRFSQSREYTGYSLLFMNELIIVVWILTALFGLAHHQAIADARIDVVESTSQLPLVTTVIPESHAPLGQSLQDPYDPTGFRIMGDQELYQRLLGQELNTAARTWRLLSAHEGYFFMFQTLPQSDPGRSVPVLKIYESGNGDQLTILSPRPVD